MANALSSIFSLMHSDSEIKLEEGLFMKLILCLRLHEIQLYYMYKIESTRLKLDWNDKVLFSWFG